MTVWKSRPHGRPAGGESGVRSPELAREETAHQEARASYWRAQSAERDRRIARLGEEVAELELETERQRTMIRYLTLRLHAMQRAAAANPDGAPTDAAQPGGVR